MIAPQRAANASTTVAILFPIRMQVLIYPGMQYVNSTLVSLTATADPMHGREAFCKGWTWLAFPERMSEKALMRTLCAGNHTTRATRERLAQYFYFGPTDGSEDEVTINTRFFIYKYCLKIKIFHFYI